jgi:hypothetical protein
MSQADLEYGTRLKQMQEQYGREARPGDPAPRSMQSSVVVNDDMLVITNTEGFRCTLPLGSLISVHCVRHDLTGGLEVKLEASPGDKDEEIRYSLLRPPGAGQEEFRTMLENLRDRVDNRGRPGATEPEGPPPFIPVKGPDLCPDDENWLMLEPLPDTVALSDGTLIKWRKRPA